jgi:pimeloyl-ACP methyl ester carboxylesterase
VNRARLHLSGLEPEHRQERNSTLLWVREGTTKIKRFTRIALVLGLALMAGSCASPPSIARTPTSSPSGESGTGPAERERARVAELTSRGTDFYDVPDPLTFGDRGALIRLQPIQDNEVARVYRVLYHSTSVDSSDVAVSGTIWVPAGTPPAGGFPIVAWAPGNNGSGDPCAYSQYPATHIDYSLLMFQLIKEGYVVAYTDYEGHGTRYPYLFAVGESQTHSLLDGARAARDLLGAAASNRIVVAGHSLGAGAAAATLQYGLRYATGLDIRGAVVLEGGADAETSVASAMAGANVSGVVQGVAGYAAAYPELHPADILTPRALRDIQLLEATCEAVRAFVDRPADEVFAANPLDVASWNKRIEASRVRQLPFPAFFVVAPTSASHVEELRAVAKRLCQTKDSVRFESYPGSDHDSVLQVARRDYFAWIADRFASKPAIGNCGE